MLLLVLNVNEAAITEKCCFCTLKWDWFNHKKEHENCVQKNDIDDGNFLISCEFQASNSRCAIDSRWVELLPTNLSNDLQNLVKIEIYNCSVKSIEENYFKGLLKLKFLIMTDINIENIANGAFLDLISLELLVLSSNRIQFLSKNTFAELKALKILDLRSNEIRFLHSKIFESLVSIKVILLGDNEIMHMNEHIFKNLANLEFIGLNDNKLEKISRKFFRNNLNLTNIFLERNEIKFIDGETFDNLPKLIYVGLHGNVCVSKNYSLNSFDSIREDVVQKCNENSAQEKLATVLRELKMELNGELKNTKVTLQELNSTYEANRLKTVNDTSTEFISTNNVLSFILMFCVADFIIATVMFVVYKYLPPRISCCHSKKNSIA